MHKLVGGSWVGILWEKTPPQGLPVAHRKPGVRRPGIEIRMMFYEPDVVWSHRREERMEGRGLPARRGNGVRS